MKILKIVIIPAVLAVLVYVGFIFMKEQNKPHSPLPEEGIKVIQITPSSE